MQIGQAQVVRYEWYDRSLKTEGGHLANNIAPHAETVRATYTVPANRVAKIVISPSRVTINTAAAPASSRWLRYKLTHDDATTTDLGYISNKLNNVGDTYGHDGISEFMLVAGEKIELFTADLSTGGLTFYIGGFVVTEYDA
jgi:hypothetical protein